MPQIRYGEIEVSLGAGETVLDALLRGGASIASSCRAGACQACLCRAASGDPGAAAQQGLRPALREQGYFLACVSRPAGDLVVAGDDDLRAPAELVEVAPLAEGVVRVRLRSEPGFVYRAGQYVQVRRDDGLVRAYSLASVPEEDDLLELHVRVHPQGRMSRWLAAEARPGARVELRGPAGDCFYTEGAPEQPMLLAGTGTGLAPLRAIVRDALRRGHRGPITLVHGARDPSGLYLADELRALAGRGAGFRYVPCVLSGETSGDVATGDIAALAARAAPQLKGWRVFLCGSPERVAALRKQSFLRGAATKDISADAFLTAAPA